MASEKKIKKFSVLKRLLKYTKPFWGLFLLALLLTVISAVLAPVRPLLIERVIDGPVSTGNFGELNQWLFLIIGLLIIQTLISFGSSYLTSWLGQSVIRDIRREVFNHITALRLRYFDTTPVGTLQTRTISDVETLNDVFSQGIVNILGDLLQVFAIVAFMFYSNVELTLIVLSTLPLLLISTYIFGRKVRVAFQEVRKYVSKMNAFLQEHISGVLVTQLFNREKIEESKFSEINKQHTDANVRTVFYYSVFFPVIELVSAIGIALIIYRGTGLSLEGKVSFGEVAAFVLYIGMFFRPVRMLADQFNTLQLGVVSAERIFQIMDTQEQLQNEGSGLVANPKNNVPAIEFKNVWFSYKDEDWVLRNVSFSVKNGDKLAIVGFTGAGKTTIINLLTRFYDFSKGDILLHGTRIEELKTEYLRSKIGLVLQDVFLFSGTILENITLNNPDISRERAIEAAHHVGADSFIQRLPGQYDWQVQERGATLSAGQRQLISFARVLAWDPEILILDEATSSVDTESEILIQKAVDKIMVGRTSIIIAHRLSTIRKANKILVMSKGEIVQEGTHEFLLNEEGLYQKLYQLSLSTA